jgi:gluconate 2-dehydrogenase gamma chain
LPAIAVHELARDLHHNVMVRHALCRSHVSETDQKVMDSLIEPQAGRQEAGRRLVTRRWVLQATLTLPALGVLGCTRSAVAPPPSAGASAGANQPPVFFSAAERSFVEAATERLIPDGDDGLGARAANVAVFIDRQLGGAFGQAAAWYMQGPFAKGTPEQGYQLGLTPAQLYRAAIADIDAHCRGKLGQAFAALAASDQDATLHALEKGEIDLPHASAKDFFDMLLKNTQEGFLADPLYGGNRDFTGWRLLGFPGPRYNYVAEITQYGKSYALPPVGLLGRNGSLAWS